MVNYFAHLYAQKWEDLKTLRKRYIKNIEFI